MRVLVTGGRDYDPNGEGRATVGLVLTAISQVKKITTIVHGRCWNPRNEDSKTGADFWAFLWAKNNSGVEEEGHPADWKKHGKAAGPIRNSAMAKLGADLCIAFPGGNGTADMVRKAAQRGIPILDLRGQ
jgi:hypothetical protein